MNVRRLWGVLGGLVWLLSACTSQASAPAATATRSATATPLPPTPSPTVTATPVPTQAARMDCTLESSLLPTPGPTEQSLFPAVGEGDWVQGPPTAAVTIVEYGDFQ